MKRSILVALVFCGLGTLARPAELPRITNAEQDPAWSALFAELGLNKARESHFEERRYFPFRKQPIVLTGISRLLPGRGLSLQYITPDPQTLIFDGKGMLLRDRDGHDRAPPDDRRARAATGALVDVMRFNLPELEKTFELHGVRQGEAWTLVLKPHDAAVARSVSALEVQGTGSHLQRIEIDAGGHERVEILISATQEDVVFPEEVLRRYFR